MSRIPDKVKAEFAPGTQLSLMGLELRYVEFEIVRDWVIQLAYKRLRRAIKTKGTISLAWHEATAIADTDLLNTLRSLRKIETARECPPWVVYVH